MKTIATLGSSVRLVVFQFLMKSTQMPAIIPPKRASNAPPLPPVSGVEVLSSTSRLDISPLASRVIGGNNYELVDVWKKGHETNWKLSFVRFVFCHKEHVKQNELHPDLIAKKKGLEESFVNLVASNLWATQGYLNPYFEKKGTDTGHKVLMLGCAGRVPNDWVFSGGRDENGRGIGPKVQLSTLSSCLTLTDANEVVLTEPVQELISAPIDISLPKEVA